MKQRDSLTQEKTSNYMTAKNLQDKEETFLKCKTKRCFKVFCFKCVGKMEKSISAFNKNAENSIFCNLEEILKLIPIVKDIDNPDNINNKFRLGIVASVVNVLNEDSKE